MDVKIIQCEDNSSKNDQDQGATELHQHQSGIRGSNGFTFRLPFPAFADHILVGADGLLLEESSATQGSVSVSVDV